MAIAVSADPIITTASILGVYNLWIVADPIEVSLSLYSTRSQYPPAAINPALDQEFDCNADSDNPDIPEVVVSITGTWFNICIIADPIEVITSLSGDYIEGVLVSASPITVETSFEDADIVFEAVKSNWIKWSGIGDLDFTISRDNVAGERPLDWRGWVYQIKKLGDRVVVYGENGVSIIKPSGKYYGLETIYRLGLKGKSAVTGDNYTHYFINTKGELYSLAEILQKLDYSEYLAAMSNPVMSHDVENELIYICDGSLGYVYSPKDKSLGSGPVNITGVSSQGGTLYVVAPAAVTIPDFEICTDIYDFRTRKNKNIYSIEVGTDLTETLEAAIDYRIDKAVSFVTTDWHTVDSRGMAFIPVMAQEVRVRVRSTVYEYFEVDSIIINGEVCSH
jgi:hypothetical protein